MTNNLEDTIKEGKERWEEIERWSKLIKAHLQTGAKMDSTNIDRLATLMLLMVDHLRPMNPSQEQVDKLTGGLTDLLKNFVKK